MKNEKQSRALGGWLLRAMLALAGLVMGLGVAQAADPQGAKARLDKDAVCTACHNESWRTPVLAIYQSKHGNRGDARAPACRDCHGQSAKHLESPANSPDVVFGAKSAHLSGAEARNNSCLTCHENNILPRTDWMGSQHETRGVACTTCHDIHTANMKVLNKATQAEVCFACHKEQRAQIHRISRHPLATEGLNSPPKMACSDCHNPHGSTGPKLLQKDTVNETCYTCHAEKRGPFLWEHAPVVDDCTNCHTPHGSTNPTLLKNRVPWLCQQCHSGDHANAPNSGANLAGGNVTTVNGILPLPNASPRAQTVARACLNCHSLVHGSNHPAGSKFQR